VKGIFIESSIFENHRPEYLSDDEFQKLQNELLANPLTGDVMQGSGGLRKIRVATKGKGKRAGSRVIYYYYNRFSRFYLLTIYAKNEMSDLTAAQKNQLKTFLEVWRNEQT
jgi:hypothetical protein